MFNGLAIEIESTLTVELWASDFDNGSTDNCGIDDLLIISPSQGLGQTSPPNEAAPSWTFDCDDIGTATVDFWVSDINGNWAYVSTYVVVQNNMNFCDLPGSYSIAGTIATEIAEPVENVIIGINSSGPNSGENETTDFNGEYAFNDLLPDLNYVITPEKNINPLNGVTTYDLVLISKQILGHDVLDSPYKLIAADINNSGTITTLDLVELRKLILYIDTAFQNNTSWRFIDATFAFPDPTNPWASSFPEIFTVNGLNSQEIADFVAVKIGDINHSAYTHDLVGEADTRNTKETISYILETENLKLRKGHTYSIPIYADQINSILGFQFTMELASDALEITSLEQGNVPEFTLENLGQNLINQGVITGSWHSIQPLNIYDRAKLFTINIKANTNSELIKELKLNSSYTKAEAYNNDFDIMSLELAFSEDGKENILFQNSPNPFVETTTIGFKIMESGKTALSVYDISGKEILKIENYLEAGYNEVEISKNELPSTGLYFYQLEPANGNSIIKKLVLTDRPEE